MAEFTPPGLCCCWDFYFTKKKKRILLVFTTRVSISPSCAHVCHIPDVQGGEESVPDPERLELQTAGQSDSAAASH